ncbi:MAG: hypothetical protein AAB289_08895 [Chloroflexota bacterium]
MMQRGALKPLEIALAIMMAATSGAALLGHIYLGMSMSYTVTFLALPVSLLLAGAALMLRRSYHRLHLLSSRVTTGALWGLAATLAYDAVRPVLVAVFQFSYDPFRAVHIFGQLITGQPVTSVQAQAAGWLYHFWNGAGFGVMYVLVRSQGGAATGFAWGMALQFMMLLAYPSFLQVRLDNPGFLVTSMVGHGTWGVVLGAGVARWRQDV